jgi:hypothetical protein
VKSVSGPSVGPTTIAPPPVTRPDLDREAARTVGASPHYARARADVARLDAVRELWAIADERGRTRRSQGGHQRPGGQSAAGEQQLAAAQSAVVDLGHGNLLARGGRGQRRMLACACPRGVIVP